MASIVFQAVSSNPRCTVSKAVIPWHDSTWGALILGTAMAWVGSCAAFCKNWDNRKKWAWPGAVALGSFALAMFFKFADGTGHLLCSPGASVAFGPKTIIQGHALWHVLSALGMLSVFEFYTSLRGRWGSVWPWRE